MELFKQFFFLDSPFPVLQIKVSVFLFEVLTIRATLIHVSRFALLLDSKEDVFVALQLQGMIPVVRMVRHATFIVFFVTELSLDCP